MVPDVDQDPGVGNCWLVATANLLAAAGHGDGATTQERAEGLYSDLKGLYPNDGDAGGHINIALNTWLMRHSDGDSGYYKIEVQPYFRDRPDGADQNDYLWLLDQMNEDKYVGVEWAWQPTGQPVTAHAMALVAGDTDDPGQSVWRDGNTHAVEDDIADNSFSGVTDDWRIDGDETEGFTVPTSAWAQLGVLLSFGKPNWAVNNYDVQGHWDEDGEWVLTSETGTKVDDFDYPVWNDVDSRLELDNESDPDQVKHVFVELLFDESQDPNALDLENWINVGTTETGYMHYLVGDWGWNMDNTRALAKFEIIPQPGSEYITFDSDIQTLAAVNIATYCVPEPMTVTLLLPGVLLVLRRRRQAD